MAIFGKTKKNNDSGKTVDATQTKKVVVKRDYRESGRIMDVVISPRITEKATMLAEKNIYTFNVSSRANKKQVESAVMSLFKVKPLSVKIVAIPSKNVFVRGKKGVKSGGKKAYVFLKPGDKIEIL